MQERFVLPTVGQRELVQRKLRHRFETNVKIVKAVDRSQDLVNGRVGAPRRLVPNGNDFGFLAAEPGDEGCKPGHVNLCSRDLLITKVLPEQF